MPDWDADSSQLSINLTQLLYEAVMWARARGDVSIELARHWQKTMMRGLQAPDSRYVGAFRGEPGLEDVEVLVAKQYGVPAAEVVEDLSRFEATLQRRVTGLDALIRSNAELDADQLNQVIDLCAWAHAEWVRIHPFANGNGRTARVWANSLAMRYGLPPFIRLRPRPNSGYGYAGAQAMFGDWKPTAKVFHRLLNEFLNN